MEVENRIWGAHQKLMFSEHFGIQCHISKKKTTIQHFYNGDLLVDFQTATMSQTQKDWKAESAAPNILLQSL